MKLWLVIFIRPKRGMILEVQPVMLVKGKNLVTGWKKKFEVVQTPHKAGM